MGEARGRAPAAASVAVALLLALLLLAATAHGERRQQGTLIVSLDGGVVPNELPRHDPAPVAVRLSGELRTADRSPLPRLRRVELTLYGGGRIDTRGLAVCSARRLRATDPETALALCGPALVGRGRLAVEVFLPHQDPFTFHGSLRAFNGRRPGGRRVVWLQVYGPDPPTSFVLPFEIHRRRGATTLVATLPADLGPAPHLARFEMTLGRRFASHGRRRSYLSASCPLPPRFGAGVFPFARATYGFAGGREVSTTIVRGCRVRG